MRSQSIQVKISYFTPEGERSGPVALCEREKGTQGLLSAHLDWTSRVWDPLGNERGRQDGEGPGSLAMGAMTEEVEVFGLDIFEALPSRGRRVGLTLSHLRGRPQVPTGAWTMCTGACPLHRNHLPNVPWAALCGEEMWQQRLSEVERGSVTPSATGAEQRQGGREQSGTVRGETGA